MGKRYVKRIRKPETMNLPPRSTAGGKKRWNRVDMQYLLANHKTMYVEDLALQLGRTVKSIKDKAFLMGCSIKSKPKGN